MANRIEILDPTSIPEVVTRSLSPRTRELAGARIGFLSNKKANADALLGELERLLRERLGAFEAHRAAKSAPLPAPEEVLRGLSRCMAVVTAVADWGSCTSWSLHDTLWLESAGVPTALVCSDEFAPLARAESIARGCPGVPLVALPHPVAGNRADLVRQKAEAVADEVLSVLTEPADALARRYEGRFTKPAERRLSRESVCVDPVCALDLPRSR